jgi:hypothetical protein
LSRARHFFGSTALGRPPTAENLPLVQLEAADGTLFTTLSPTGLRDFFTASTLEHAQRQPIDDAMFEKLARALRTEVTQTFRRDIYATTVGTSLMIVHQWHSPRRLVELLENLKRDSLKTIADRDDNFAAFVARTVQEQAVRTGRSSRQVIDEQLVAIRETIGRGRPDEEVRSVFFEAVVATAQKYDVKLALPPRDDSRGLASTPLFEFALAMRDLVVDCGRAMLARRGLSDSRFSGFTRLRRKRLIYHLEAARSVILREKSRGSVNSPKSVN